MKLLHDKFSHQEEENKISYTSTPKISIYLFKHFYFFHFISTQFTDFVSLKIQMQITFAKSFNDKKVPKTTEFSVLFQVLVIRQGRQKH